MVIEEYMDGKGSLLDLIIKYEIPSDATLSKWI